MIKWTKKEMEDYKIPKGSRVLTNHGPNPIEFYVSDIGNVCLQPKESIILTGLNLYAPPLANGSTLSIESWD